MFKGESSGVSMGSLSAAVQFAVSSERRGSLFHVVGAARDRVVGAMSSLFLDRAVGQSQEQGQPEQVVGINNASVVSTSTFLSGVNHRRATEFAVRSERAGSRVDLPSVNR